MIIVADATDELMAYTRASEKDRPYVDSCAAAAVTLISTLTQGERVPEPIVAQAILLTGDNLWRRRASASEVQSLMDPTLTSITPRPALDPTTPARRLLAPYLGPGIA